LSSIGSLSRIGCVQLRCLPQETNQQPYIELDKWNPPNHVKPIRARITSNQYKHAPPENRPIPKFNTPISPTRRYPANQTGPHSRRILCHRLRSISRQGYTRTLHHSSISKDIPRHCSFPPTPLLLSAPPAVSLRF
jgi:hypothetical protein